MKTIGMICLIVFCHLPGSSQNVGIGTDIPAFPLHVEGTIFSNTQLRTNGLGYFGQRVQIGIGGQFQENYQLHVQGETYLQNLLVGWQGNLGSLKMFVGGNARINGNLQLDGSLSSDLTVSAQLLWAENIYASNNLTVSNNAFINNDGIVAGNFRVNGRVGINGATNESYGLIVNDANSYFQGNTNTTGNATVTGAVNANGNLTIKGNGHVRSAGSSNLRVGFAQKSFNEAFSNNAAKEFTVNLDDFDIGNANIRVCISQFDPDPAPAYAYWRWFDFKVYDVDAVAHTCRVNIINQSGLNCTLKGTLYLMTVAKE